MIRTHQESIDSLKQMLAQLLEDKRKSPSRKYKGKRKEGESSSSVHPEENEQPTSDASKSPSQGKGDRDQEKVHSRRMNRLEQRLEALPTAKASKKQE